jgi:hypothetical protein
VPQEDHTVVDAVPSELTSCDVVPQEDHTVAEASLSELLKAVMVMQVHLDQDVRLEVPLVDGKVCPRGNT